MGTKGMKLYQYFTTWNGLKFYRSEYRILRNVHYLNEYEKNAITWEQLKEKIMENNDLTELDDTLFRQWIISLGWRYIEQ